MLPSQACYIRCCSACNDWATSREPTSSEDIDDVDNDAAVEANPTASNLPFEEGPSPLAVSTKDTTKSQAQLALDTAVKPEADLKVGDSDAANKNHGMDVETVENKADTEPTPPYEGALKGTESLTSLESLLTAVDDPAAKGALDEFTLLKHRLPIFFSWNRCLKCFTFHEAGKCANHFLEYNVFEPAEDENDIDQIKRKFLSEMVNITL